MINIVALAILLFLPFSAYAAEDGLYGEVGTYIQSAQDTGATDDRTMPGMIGGVFYGNSSPFTPGIELAGLGWATGAFATGKVAIGDKFNFLVGVGGLGYNVANEYNNFYTKELATMFGASLDTEYGTFVARVITSQYKDPMGRKTVNYCAEYDNHEYQFCDSNGTTSLNEKSFTKQAIMIGYQLSF